MERVQMMNCGDKRRRADNGCFGRGPHAKTANTTLIDKDTGRIFTNAGAAGAVTLTLPAPKAGLYYHFAVVAAQNLTVQASGGAKVNNSAANGTFAALGTQAGVGNCRVWCDGSNWFVMAQGTWTTT